MFSSKFGGLPHTKNIHAIHLQNQRGGKKSSSHEGSFQCSIYIVTKERKQANVLPASYPQSRNKIASLVVVSTSGRSLHRSTHAVFVILTNEDARQLPQRCHIICLKDLTLQKQPEKVKSSIKVPLMWLFENDLLCMCNTDMWMKTSS